MTKKLKNNFFKNHDQLDENVCKKIFINVISLINLFAYVRLTWEILSHPKNTFHRLLKDKTPSLLEAGSFFIFNILLVMLLGELIGYKADGFPFKIPILSSWLGDISYLVLRYMLGAIVFLFLLKFFIKFDKLKIFLPKAFLAICYASAIYVPFILTKRLFGHWSGETLMNFITSFLSNTSFKISAIDYFAIAAGLIMQVIFVFWWLWLVYAALIFLAIAETKRLKKNLFYTYCTFFIFQLITTFLLGIIAYMPLLKAYKIITFNEIEKTLSLKPPNYLKAAFLAEKIADTEGMFPYLRYAAKIRAATYTIATPVYKINDKFIVDKALKGIAGRNYEEVEDMLTKYVKKLLKKTTDPNRPLYVMLLQGLGKAQEFRNSPNYVQKQEEFSLFLIFPPAPLALFP